jgi:ribosomal protein S18 acetylase RimI-like enzyme
MDIRHGVLPKDIDILASLWAQLGWGKDDADGQRTIQAAISGSSWFGLAEIDGEFAGYARALTDGIVVTYLVEVAVLPVFRCRGVGSALIESCLAAFAHTAVYADVGPEAVALFTRHGIRPRPSYLTACARGPSRIDEPVRP